MPEHQWDPQALLGLSNNYWQTCVLHTAVKLNLFSHLDDQPLPAEDLAKKVGANQDGMERLLAALVAMDLLGKSGECFICRPGTAQFLSRRSSRYLGHIIQHHRQLMESWAHLDESVQTGRPVRSRYAGDDPEWRRNFLLGMHDLALLVAPKLVGRIDLAGRCRLLDLGGGPGTWAIHFCLQNSDLQATVYDLPNSRELAEETIARFGLQERIAFVGGDFLRQELTGNYDVVWLSHILHGEGLQDVRTILEQAASVLDPGGLLLIHEFVLNDDGSGPLFPALFSLNMLLGTPAGRSYSAAQLLELLQAAGFKDGQVLDLGLFGESSVLSATV